MPEQNAKTGIDLSQSGAQTGGAQSGAGVGTQQAGAQTGAAQAGAGAAGQLAQEETVSDVGQGEAYILNMKRLVENALNMDEQLKQVLVRAAQRSANAEGDFDGQVRKLSLDALVLGNQALANAVALAGKTNSDAQQHGKNIDSINQSERERTLRNGDMLDVIREAGVSADTTVFQDAIEAAVVKALTKAGVVSK